MRLPGRPQSIALTLVALAGTPVVAHAQGPGDDRPERAKVQAPTRLIDGPGGPRLYRFQHAGDGALKATRLGLRDAGEEGEVTITGRVLVRTADQRSTERVRAWLAFRGLFARPIPGLPGTLVVDARGALDAVDLAEEMQHSGPALGVADATPEIRQAVGPRVPSDFGLADQWYLINTLPGEELFDLNVEPAWNAGWTGAGVTVGIIDQGIELTNFDLVANIDPEPAHSQQGVGVDAHATSVAGIVAMTANNVLGGAGVAYNARLTNHTYGDPSVTASSLLRANHANDIKNNSWGPADIGRIFYPSAIVMDAIEESARSGRDGLGTVLVWAGGNGALRKDRVDYDPYASSRYTIAIGAYDDTGVRAIYSEPGSSLFAVAPSSGGSKAIFTTALGGWTGAFGFTSAAAPQGAGVVALMLEANPALSWRDVQHVLRQTAWRIDPDNPTWAMNSAGVWFSDDYGFGALDASAAATLAEAWTPVAPEISAASGVVSVETDVPNADATGIARSTTIDADITIESVEVIVNIQTPTVGDLDIELISPTGTVSTLAAQRPDGTDDYTDWVFTSLRHWGEPSRGEWTLRVADRNILWAAYWQDFEVRVHGTAGGPTPCDPADLAEPFGERTFADAIAFLQAFQAGDPRADLAAPTGVFDVSDIAAFVTAFQNGCP